MTSESLKLLNELSNTFLGQVRENLSKTGTTATGKTASSLRYTITDQGPKILIEVFGRKYFSTVETGRKPTPDKKPSREMINNIKEWTSARGIPESAAWAIAVNINKKGSKLFRAGGRTDIYTDLKEGFSDKVFMELSENIASEFFRNVQVAFQ